MKHPLRLFFAALIALLALSPAVRAQIIITVTATAQTGEQGYNNPNPDQSYDFVYTLAASFPPNPNYSLGVNNAWFQDVSPPDAQLFTTVGGSGLAGTFSAPTDPYSRVQAGSDEDSTFLLLLVDSDVGNIGVTTLSDSTLRAVHAAVYLEGVDFTNPAAYTNPADYFLDYLGDYTASGAVSLFGDDFSQLTFAITSINISVSAIPEPSTYAALFGLGACLAVALKRRRALGLVAWRRAVAGCGQHGVP